MKKDVQITIRVTEEMMNDLEELAASEDRTVSDYIRSKMKLQITKQKAVSLSSSESSFAEREERIKQTAAKIQSKL